MVAIQTLRLACLTVAIIGLVTGRLGILNISLATLPDRVVELALRRSAGATRRSIVLLMVTESVLVGALAAIAAAALSYFLYPAASRMIFPDIASNDVSQFPLSSSLIGVGAGMLAGLEGGIAPAQKSGGDGHRVHHAGVAGGQADGPTRSTRGIPPRVALTGAEPGTAGSRSRPPLNRSRSCP